jgi:hypothetical protein
VRATGPLLLAGAVAAGVVIRLAAGLPLVGTDLAFEGPPRAGPAAPGSPEQAVQSFYAALAAGDYAAAWEASVEPAWPGADGAPWAAEVAAVTRPAGWTAKDAFVRRCSDDIGSGIRLNSVSAVAAAGEAPGQELDGAPAGALDGGLAGALGARQVRAVHVSGHMLGACLIYRWEKDLAVADVGGKWKVILPGTKAAREPFHRAWFADVTLVGSLRAQPVTSP